MMVMGVANIKIMDNGVSNNDNTDEKYHNREISNHIHKWQR